MPPKRQLTEQKIIDAAFELVRRDGFEALTARTVAQELGVSTMPIYSRFRSMESLIARLRERTLDLLVDHQAERKTGDVFVDSALGYVRFAREEPKLFRFYFVDQAQTLSMAEQRRMRERVFQRLELEGPPDSAFTQLPEAVQEAIAFRTWIFVHGLAVMVSSGVLEDSGDDALRALIEGAGGAFGTWELAQRAR